MKKRSYKFNLFFSIIFPTTNPPARHITAPNMRTPISPSDPNGSKSVVWEWG